MAGDLIPPPSPAGRPTSPGGTPNLIELPPEPPRSPAQPAQQPAPGPSAFRNRFGFLMGSLAGVFVAATLVLIAVVATNGDSSAVDEGLAANWSRWHPTDSSIEGGAPQIADQIGAKYKHPNGQQLVLVLGGMLPSELHVALRPSSGRIAVLDGPTVVYRLNGLGPNNSIKGGKPSPERAHVIQREALELALYTFRYLPDAQGVLVTLPPLPPDAAATATPSATTPGAAATPTPTPTPDPNERQLALFYRPGDLLTQLQIPLGHTVPAKTPNADTIKPAEAKTIDELTASNLFVWELQPATGLLVLDHPPAP